MCKGGGNQKNQKNQSIYSVLVLCNPPNPQNPSNYSVSGSCIPNARNTGLRGDAAACLECALARASAQGSSREGPHLKLEAVVPAPSFVVLFADASFFSYFPCLAFGPPFFCVQPLPPPIFVFLADAALFLSPGVWRLAIFVKPLPPPPVLFLADAAFFPISRFLAFGIFCEASSAPPYCFWLTPLFFLCSFFGVWPPFFGEASPPFACCCCLAETCFSYLPSLAFAFVCEAFVSAPAVAFFGRSPFFFPAPFFGSVF